MSGPLRILLVEDERLIRLEVAARLARLGYEVCGQTGSGEEALELAAALRPDLVLMDVTLEGPLDGIDAAEILRDRLPVVFLTADATGPALERAAGSSAQAFLLKPCRDADLRAAVEMSLQRHRLERSLAESEARYRRLYENAPVGIFQAEPSGRMLRANPALVAMLGYADEAELLRNLPDVFAQLFADSDQSCVFQRKLAREGRLDGFEAEFYGRDGDVIWVSLSASLDEGEDQRLDGIVLDISARREAQQAVAASFDLLSRTMDAMGHAVALTDLDGHVILANEALASLLDMDRAALRERSYPELLDQDDLPRISEQSCGMVNVRGIQHLETASPFHDAQGRVIGVVRVLRPMADILCQLPDIREPLGGLRPEAPCASISL